MSEVIELSPTPYEKTDTFFIISNYNTDPEIYLKYCNDYLIYDQTPDAEMANSLRNKYGTKLSQVLNTGHNISDYLRFFVDNYEDLPETLMLLKGNIIGRHVSQAFFDRVYKNKFYTMLYDDRNWRDNKGIAYQLHDGAFLEINNSWYISTKPHKYFNSYNHLLTFLFKNPIIPEWTLFSPGACYIVLKRQILRYPKTFYQNLLTIIDYIYFPSEAYILERMLHVIFMGVYDLQDYCADIKEFKRRIEEQAYLNTLKPVPDPIPPVPKVSIIRKIARKVKSRLVRVLG